MYHKSHKESFHSRSLSPFSYKLLLELFPFAVMVDTKMNIIGLGKRFIEIWRGTEPIYDRHITNFFKLRRPKGIQFSWKNVLLSYL